MTIQGGIPAEDINQLLLRMLGAFSHLQLLIDELLAKSFFEKRVPKAAAFLLKRVVSRIRDDERTQLVQVIAAELGAPAELDNFNQVYMHVKRLRDKVSHAARFQSDGQDVLHITDSLLRPKAPGPTFPALTRHQMSCHGHLPVIARVRMKKTVSATTTNAPACTALTLR